MKNEPQSPPWSKGTGTIGGSGAGTGADRGPASMATAVLPQPKQIRFVNNEGRPPAKRRRVDSACQTCRKRKIRCDGRRPKCSTCESNRHECLGYILSPTPASGSGTKSPEIKRQESADGIKNEEDEDKDNHIPLLSSAFKPDNSRHNLDNVNGRRRSSTSAHRDENSADSDDDIEAVQALPRHKVPYFRWFGPTAIVKAGYKQMVVALENQPAKGPTSLNSGASPQSVAAHSDDGSKQPMRRASGASESRPSPLLPELPTYTAKEKNMPVQNLMPVHNLILHLVDTFFKNLGCTFPFLEREKHYRMVQERALPPILVNVMCALAARFSTHPLLTTGRNPKLAPAFYGYVYAQRAKAFVTQEFVRPTPEGSQAMLLLAYEAFGAGQDSALWHYEGLAIRMVIDVGLQREEGIRLQRPPYIEPEYDLTEPSPSDRGDQGVLPSQTTEEEMVDTLWAIFALDRYISSGLGRRVTMRIDEFELSLPDTSLTTPTGLPAPLPALIHIMHMYGRVSDLLNSINGAEDVTEQTAETVASIEGEMLMFLESLDPRLRFSTDHFSLYFNAGEGTNYIMLNLWFHTLVILVNCPAVCDDRVILPNIKVAMALVSAKTIADMASYAIYLAPTLIAGNPFTTQPLFIAACAFLYFMKNGSQSKASVPTSREMSPDKKTMKKPPARSYPTSSAKTEEKRKEDIKKRAVKGYGQCYRALRNIRQYWAGTKYILTILVQKANGVTDPEAYTAEEMESTKLRPMTSVSTEHWRRELPIGGPSPNMPSRSMVFSPQTNGSNSPPTEDNRRTAQKRLWAMTGTTNSPNAHVAWLPPQPPQPSEAPSPAPSHSSSSIYYDPIRASLPESVRAANATANYPPYAAAGYHQAHHQRLQHGQSMSSHGSYSGDNMHDASLLLDLRSSPHPHTSGRANNSNTGSYDTHRASPPTHFPYSAEPGSYPYSISSNSNPANASNAGYPHPWISAQYHDVMSGAGSGNGAGLAQTQQAMYTEMDMPTLMQSMDEQTYDLDFLPLEYTERGGEEGWGGGFE